VHARVQLAIEHELVPNVVILVLVSASARDLDGHLDRMPDAGGLHV
jgi:hypothetical protein